MRPVPPWHVPGIVNLMFWGGLWGVLYALVADKLPGGASWLKGAIFGIIGPILIGSWLVGAFLKGQPLLAGLQPNRWIAGLLIGIGFGVALGLVYDMLRAKA
jgi:hypothetical protein